MTENVTFIFKTLYSVILVIYVILLIKVCLLFGSCFSQYILKSCASRTGKNQMPTKIPKLLDKHIRHSVSQSSKREVQEVRKDEKELLAALPNMNVGQTIVKRSRSVSPIARPSAINPGSPDFDGSTSRPDPVKFLGRKSRASDPDILRNGSAIIQTKGVSSRLFPVCGPELVPENEVSDQNSSAGSVQMNSVQFCGELTNKDLDGPQLHQFTKRCWKSSAILTRDEIPTGDESQVEFHFYQKFYLNIFKFSNRLANRRPGNRSPSAS